MNAVPETPMDQALRWAARRRLGLAGAREDAAFQAWLADADNAAAYAAVDGPADAAGDLAALPEIRAMRDAALAVAPRRRPWMVGAGLIAASLLAVAVLAPARQTILPAAETPASVAEAALVKRYASKVGERLNLTLEDGSVVTLNTASLMEVAFTQGRRDIRLLQGQAMFQVAKDKSRPFVVTAADRQITATGTAFDVRLDKGRVRVVMVEGRVVVSPIERTGLARIAPALEQQELSAGEQLSAAVAGPVSVAAADVDRATSWRKGQVIFRDDTLAAAVAEMNRYSTTQLTIEDPRIANLKISGVFGASRGENFVAAVTAFYPIRAEKRSPGVTALVPRDAASQGS